MRKVLFTLPLLLLGFICAHSQVSYSVTANIGAGNPGGVNTESDAPGQVDWVTILPGSQSANTWSAVQTLPFAFDFFGQPVTHYKVSLNGLVTFDTASTALPSANENLPSASLPDNTIAAFWDDFTVSPPTGGNDEVRIDTFGTAPNRQLWIKWYSFEIGNPVYSFAYFACVLEESTNNVYLVDKYSNTSSSGMTLGVQLDATSAIQYNDSTFTLGGNGSSNADNDNYCFMPFVQQNDDMAVTSVDLMPASACDLSSVPVTANLLNFGLLSASNFDIQLWVDGALVATETVAGPIGSNASLAYNFTATADLSAGGAHTVTAVTALVGDGNAANDTASASLTNNGAISVPYLETFDAGGLPTGWTNDPNDGGDDWEFGTNATYGPSNDHTTGSGIFAWVDDSSPHAAPINLITPCLDLNILSPRMEFWIYSQNTNATNPDVTLHVDIEDANGWTNDIVPPMTSMGASWNLIGTSLAAYAGQTVRIRFRAIEPTGTTFQHDMAIDDFRIFSPPAIDLGATALVSPAAAGCYGSADSVTVTIENYGIDTLDFSTLNATIAVNVTGASTQSVMETLSTGMLLPGATMDVTFASTVDLSNQGQHDFEIYTSISGDGDASNDTTFDSRTTVIALAPMLGPVDFTGYTGANLDATFPGWTEAEGAMPTGTTSGWVRDDFGNVIGSNGDAARFNLFDAGDIDWILSPKFMATSTTALCYDAALTAFGSTSPASLGSDDRVQVMISTDCGASYAPIFTYDSASVVSNTGQSMVHLLSAYDGQDVIIGFVADEGSVDDIEDVDFFLDNIAIKELNNDDLAAVEILGLQDNICGTTDQMLQVVVNNAGINSQGVYDVVVQMMGGNSGLASASGTIALGENDTLMVGPFNTLAGGMITFTASVVFPSDEDQTNNTVSASVNISPIPAIPSVADGSACDSGMVTLMAAGGTSEFFWYDAMSGGTLLGTGSSFTTPMLSATTTYYVEGADFSTTSVGPADNTFGGGGDYGFFPDGVVFDVLAPSVTIDSVTVYPNGVGDIIITVSDAGGATVATTTIPFAGTVTDTTLYLGFAVPAGTGYSMHATGSTISGLFRNNSSAVYPYTVPGVISLTNAINNLGSFYYFFYDWKVSTVGCASDRVPVTAHILTSPTVDLGADQLVCDGDMATLDAGNPGMSYMWSTGDTTQTLMTGMAGTYMVTVTNADGCSSMDSVMVSVNPAIMAMADSMMDVACNGGNDGAIYVSVSGGTAPYSFDWSNGDTTEDVLNLSAGVYMGTITDANGCTFTTGTMTINEPTAISVSVDSTNDVLCSGSSSGALYISVSGGTGPYTYSWSNGSTDEDPMGLPAGDYTGTITDANGCTFTSPVLTINENPAIEMTIDQVSDASCNGEMDGSISITISGGEAPYTYDWSNGETTDDISDLGAGTYSAMVMDANGCTFETGDITITEPDALSLALDASGDETCTGDGNGYLLVSVTGGTAPYSYDWSTGQTTEDLGDLMGGTYDLTVTDANGCEIEAQYTIATLNMAPDADFNYSVAGGDVAFMNMSSNAVTYSWDFGDGSPLVADPNPTHTYTANGTYSVQLIVTNSCGSDTTMQEVNLSTVSIEEEILASAISLYPNPSNGQFNVSFDGLNSDEVSVSVFTIDGKQVYKQSFGAVMGQYLHSVDISQLAKGVYVVQINSEGHVLHKRLVVE